MDKEPTINFITWNINGFLKRRVELATYLEEYNVDVALISETRLSPHIKVGIPGYSIVRSDRQESGGGTAVVAKDYLKIRQVQSPPNVECAIAVMELDGKITKAIAIYIPPGNPINKEEMEELLQEEEQIIILGGDFNAHNCAWGGRYTTKAGREIVDITRNTNSKIIAPIGETNFPGEGRRGDSIDFFIVKNLKKQTKVEIDAELLSDHAAVKLTFPRSGKEFRETRSYTTTNWEKYRSLTRQFVACEALPTEWRVERLTQAMKKAKEESSTTITNADNRHFLSTEEKEMVRRKHRAKQDFLKERTRAAKEALNKITNEVREMIKEKNAKKWQEKIKRIKEEPNGLWQAARILRRQKEAPQPLQSKGKYFFFRDEDIAEEMASYYEEVFTNEEKSQVELLEIEKTNEGEAKQWTTGEVQEIIKKLHKKKAPGPDGIDNQMLRQASENIIEELTKIFNAAAEERRYPKLWKEATIIPIPKKQKDATKPENRRPISLLNTMGKILDILLKEELAKFLEENRILPESQYGFRKEMGAVMQAENLARIVDEIRKKKKSKQVYAVLLDMEKAYDKTWKAGLRHKLAKIKVPIYLQQMLASFMEDRKFRVRINKTLSRVKVAAEGLPQGSPLSPILFNVMVYDIPKTKEATILQFADDIAVVATGQGVDWTTGKAERATKRVIDWTKEWKLKINNAKTEVARLAGKRYCCGKIRIGDTVVRKKTEITYLGITFNKRHAFNSHVKRRLALGKQSYGKLYRLINNDQILEKEEKILLIQKIIEPQVTYGMEVWTNRNQKLGKIIEGFIMKRIRRAGDFDRFQRNDSIRAELGRKPIWQKAEEQREKMLQKSNILKERMKNG